MTTHLRARTAQAGAFLALVGGVLAGYPTAALAAPPGVRIDSGAGQTVSSGSTVTISYTVSNQRGDGDTGDGTVNLTVAASNGGNCVNGCEDSSTINGTRNFTTTIKAPDVGTGQSRQVSVTITAKANNTGEVETGTATASFTVQGAAAPTTVRQVSGRIKDDENARVSGVKVVMKDSAGQSYTTSTDGDGGYAFTSSDSKPIAAGSITVAATKSGYDAASATVQGAVGKTVNVPLTIKKVVAASPSASPSASASASAEATEETTEEETTEEETPGVDLGQDPNEAANNSDDSGSNWLLIIMGVLLVAAGLGAMLLVWLRRKKAEELAETGIGKIPPASGGGGSFDQTRVAAPVGAGRGGDATMIAPAGGMGGGGSLGDAPTMIHRQPVEDEFPDPYGAPLPANGGYNGQNNQQWGNEPADNYGQQGGGSYGGGTQPYGQQGGGAYGAAQGGGQTQRYDEHTNMYQPEQPHVPQQQQRYDEATGMYQPQQGGYDQGGYDQGQGGYDQGGYGQQGGYDQGGYGQQQGGWDQQGGYDQGGYGQQQGGWDNGQQQQQGGYGQQQQGGWDDDQNGYDQHGNGYGNNNGQNRNWNG